MDISAPSEVLANGGMLALKHGKEQCALPLDHAQSALQATGSLTGLLFPLRQLLPHLVTREVVKKSIKARGVRFVPYRI